MEKVLVLGAKGFLGSQIFNYFLGIPRYSVCQSDQRITEEETLHDIFNSFKPDVVISAIGRTGNRSTDDCNNNTQATVESNVIVPRMIAKTCECRGVYMVHLSTGCLWDRYVQGKLVFSESDPYCPEYISAYHASKMVIDQWLIENFPQALVLRVRLPISHNWHLKDLITKLIGFSRVYDVFQSVTVVEDMLPALETLIRIRERGAFNMTTADVHYPSLIRRWNIISGEKREFLIVDPSPISVSIRKPVCSLSTEKVRKVLRENRHTLPEGINSIDGIMRRRLSEMMTEKEAAAI